MDFSRLFYSEDGVEGLNKRSLLFDTRVIAPHWRDATPTWRTTWEQLHLVDASAREAQVRRLAAAPRKGLRLVRRLETEAGLSPLGIFIETHIRAFAGLLGLPEGGIVPFDLDAFIEIAREERPTAIVEIFPRSDPDVPVQGFGSRLRFQAPLTSTEARGPRGVLDNLAHHILAERLAAGQTIEELTLPWITHRGIWGLEKLSSIGDLLNECAFAVIESKAPGAATIIDSMAEMRLDGKIIDGEVTRTRGRRGPS